MIVLNTPLTIKKDCKYYAKVLLVKYKYILTGKFKAYKITTHPMGITFSQQ